MASRMNSRSRNGYLDKGDGHHDREHVASQIALACFPQGDKHVRPVVALVVPHLHRYLRRSGEDVIAGEKVGSEFPDDEQSLRLR